MRNSRVVLTGMIKPFEFLLIVIVFSVSLMGTSISLRLEEKTLKASASNFFSAFPFAAGKKSLSEIKTENIQAEAFLIATASGDILAEKNAESSLPIASVTKIMTALVLRQLPAGTEIWLSERSKQVPPKHSKLQAGAVISKEAAETLLLVESDNDIAEAIAESGGVYFNARTLNSRESFIEEMNRTAAALGMRNSTFKNPSGLDEEGHQSTAKDLFRLMQSVSQRYPDFWLETEDPPKTVASLSGASYPVKSSNLILGRKGLLGAKTGFSEEALGALVFEYRNQIFPEDLIIIVLRSPDRFRDAERLMGSIDRAFSTLPK